MNNKTSISAGLAVYDLLKADSTVSETVTDIFPVLINSDEDVRLPYICFNRERTDHIPVKTGVPGSDTATIVVAVYWDTDNYTALIALSEAVRGALEYKTYESQDGISMRSCRFSDSREYADQEGHVVEELIFTLKT